MKVRAKLKQSSWQQIIDLPYCGLYQGDNIEVLRQFPDNCFGSCVCDPPYGLEFMGASFDCLTPKWKAFEVVPAEWVREVKNGRG